MPMPSAEILSIGTELLLGEIVDTNAAHLARSLRDVGIDVYRKTTVGDNVARIAAAVRTGLSDADVVIATGGLGPTVDDMTRAGIAAAIGVATAFQPELWVQVQAMLQQRGREPTDNNRRQAYLPAGARAIPNPVGTAPAFVFETDRGGVVALPGVPREMVYLLEHAVIPYLRDRYGPGGSIRVRVLHTAGAGESQIDALIGDLESLANPTVGLAAHVGRVDVRITAKAPSDAGAAELIAPVEVEVRRRLGDWVVGAE